jgi:hypothetical protein
MHYDTYVTHVGIQSTNKERSQPFPRPQDYILIRLSYEHQFTLLLRVISVLQYTVLKMLSTHNESTFALCTPLEVCIRSLLAVTLP